MPSRHASATARGDSGTEPPYLALAPGAAAVLRGRGDAEELEDLPVTPPPSDADKPGAGGPKPGGAPSTPAQPDPGRTESRPGAKSPAPAVGGAKPVPVAPNQPGAPGTGSPAATPPKPATEPVLTVKPGSPGAADGKPEAGKPLGDGAKPSAAGTDRPGESKPAASQPGATASSGSEAKLASGIAGPKSEPGKLEPGKPEASKVEPGKPETGKVEPGKPEAAKPDPTKAGQPGAGAQGGGGPRPGAAATGAAAAAVTAGPILDLKAKRIPDPPQPGKDAPKDAPRDGSKETGKETAKDTAKVAAKEPPKGSGTTALTPVTPPAGRARAGFGSLAAAGLIGGLIGAGALFGAERAGLGTVRPNASDPSLSGQVASLDKRVDGLAPRDAVADLDKRVAAAEAAARQALEKAPAPGGAATDGQAPATNAAVPADLAARLDSLDQRVAALQEEPGRDQGGDAKLGAAQAADPKQVADLDARVKALEADQPDKGAAAEASKTIAALQGEVEQRTKANATADAALGQRLDSLQQALDARVKAATEAVQAATQASRTAAEAGQTQAAEAAKAVDRRLQEQADKIAALDKSVSQRAEISTVQAALRVVVADRVASALAAGMPYAEPLTTLRKLDPGAEAQATALAPFAETGAPTTAQLANAFRPVAEQVAAKRRSQLARSAAETGDFRTKLLSMADGLVQVRKVDAPAATPEASDEPEAKVQAALDRGDLPAASAAFAALPPEMRDQAGDFAAKLKARAAAEESVRALLAGVFKALPTDAASGAAPAAPGR
ncbi:translation initiation factor 2 [Methylobacterium sp. WL64]|uniref:translation initiation factor 2 n=1 Tax=Methylobacterium sp. WL64 TaxID=2603894 RepID=UPI0011C74649|nr:translation initiation factor 2 [Methylobacterium sp. WL64]TXN04212.1 translation initiation factor 2 [Methylobacterium sp. WL64]